MTDTTHDTHGDVGHVTSIRLLVAVWMLRYYRGGRLRDASLRRWLARADLRQLAAPRELLGRVLDVLKRYPEGETLRAIREATHLSARYLKPCDVRTE